MGHYRPRTINRRDFYTSKMGTRFSRCIGLGGYKQVLDQPTVDSYGDFESEYTDAILTELESWTLKNPSKSAVTSRGV